MRRGVLGGRIKKEKEASSTVIENLNTYVQGGAKAFALKKKGGVPAQPAQVTQLAPPPPPADANFDAANDATARLMKKTGQNEPAEKLLLAVEEGSAAQAAVKKKPTASKKRSEKEKEIEEPPRFGEILKRTRKEETLPLPANVTPLEDYKKRDTELNLYAKQIVEREHRAANDYIMKLPKLTGTLQYTRHYASTQWYGYQVETVANSPGLTFQKVPFLTRVYLQSFLREPDPKLPHLERPCFNLDRDPFEGEQMARCISHILKGFRLREIVFPEQEILLNNALLNGEKNPKLSPLREMCYLCHIYYTTMQALHQKSHYDEKRKKDLTEPVEVEKRRKCILNKFQVDVDVPYGYDKRCMIDGDIVSMCIWGGFPEWSEQNYVQVQVKNPQTDQLLRGYAEREHMLFQPSRIPFHQNESESKTHSTRSALTGSAQ